MDVLIVEPIEADVLQWLSTRHNVRYAPELAGDPRALRQALFNLRALIVPPSLVPDAQTLLFAPVLRAVGVVGGSLEQVDLTVLARAGVDVVRSATASAVAEAEFIVGALIAMLRRQAPRVDPQAGSPGRELGGATVGLIGMVPAARTLAQLLKGFGSQVIGYDPAVHSSDGLWERWQIDPVALADLMPMCDAVCVQLPFYSRYRGLLGERFLPLCRPGQVLVSVTHSALFDEAVLAEVLDSGRMAAAWLDDPAPGALEPGRPLHAASSLHVTPRLAGATRESRTRGAWAVARRIDELLLAKPAPPADVKPESEDGPADLEDGEASA